MSSSSSSASALHTTVKLSTGAELPVVGFGTWRAAPKDTENSVYTALQAGYRHIDCARVYANEKVTTREAAAMAQSSRVCLRLPCRLISPP